MTKEKLRSSYYIHIYIRPTKLTRTVSPAILITDFINNNKKRPCVCALVHPIAL